VKQLLGPWLAALFRIALGVIFVWASLDKLLHPAAFAASISHYRLVPLGAINLMAICLPWIELCAGVALVLGLWTRAGLLIVDGLLAIFIVAIVSALRRDLDISCGCFSTDPTSHQMTRWTLYWDAIWLGMGLHALLLERGRLSVAALFRKQEK